MALTVIPFNLFHGRPPNPEASLYVLPAGGYTLVVTRLIAINTTAVAANISASIVPNGGTAGPANRIFSAESVAANKRIDQPLNMHMGVGDFLSGLNHTANSITLLAIGFLYAP